MLEFFVGFALLGSFVASVLTPQEKPQPKKTADSIHAIEAMLLVASLDKSLSDDDRQKLNQAIEALKKN
jgi:hypothetical protein